jgi:hypothetical protein
MRRSFRRVDTAEESETVHSEQEQSALMCEAIKRDKVLRKRRRRELNALYSKEKETSEGTEMKGGGRHELTTENEERKEGG